MTAHKVSVVRHASMQMTERRRKGAEPKRQGEMTGNQDGGCTPLIPQKGCIWRHIGKSSACIEGYSELSSNVVICWGGQVPGQLQSLQSGYLSQENKTLAR